MASAAESPSGRMRRLVEESPLCHPGVFSIACRDHDQQPPEHLRRIHGQAFKGIRGEGPRFLCHLKPREHGKSEAGSVDLVAWRALSDPTSRTLIMSEGSGLAENKLEQVREVVERWAPAFGRRVVHSNNSELELENDAEHGEATVEAAGFGSSVTGGHFDVIVFDDLVDWPSQRTEARRDKIWQQFQNYLNLGSEGETLYLVLGTRKHPDDLYSNLLGSAGWYCEVDRAIQDWSLVESREYDLITQNPDTGARSIYRASDAGSIGDDEAIVDAEPHREVDVLWPERWPLNKLLVDMHSGFGGDEGNLVWKRENQNAADALLGQVLSEDMLVFAAGAGIDVPPERELQLVYGLDPAVEEDPEKAASNDTDYWALSKLGHDSRADRTFVLDVWRERGMSLRRGIMWAAGHVGESYSSLMVENQLAQRWFVQEARDLGLNVTGSPSHGSKEDRVIQMSARFESGRVVLAGAAEDWSGKDGRVPRFVNEWAGFPGADHDDRLDAVEIGLRGTGGSTMRRSEHDMSDLPG